MRFKIVFLLLIVLLITVGIAHAHGYIVRSLPADRSVLKRAPHQVQIWFSEGLESRFSTIQVFDQRGDLIAEGGTDPRNNTKLIVDLPANLSDGAYLVRLRPVFTSDGHAINDTMVFWVGAQVGNIDTGRASGNAIPLEAVWRVILTLSLTILCGTIWIYGFVLRPTWGNPHYELGHLPPRVMYRLSILLWGSLVIAFVINILALFQITMTVFDTGIDKVLSDSLWEVVLEGTNFGDVWQIRMLLLIGMLLVQIVAAQQARNRPQSTHYLWLLNGFLALLLLGTLSMISHAAGSPLLSPLGVIVDYVHLTAVAIWIGGVIVIALILRSALAPLSSEDRGKALKAMLKRFSMIAAVALSLIIMTGIYNTVATIYRPADLGKSTYGLTLIAKWILMLPLIGLGALHYITISPERLAKVAEKIQAVQRFIHIPQTLQLEGVFAFLIMLAAATLPATPPPQPPNARGDVAVQTQQLTVEGYEIELAVSPSAVGANSFDVRITQNGQSVDLESAKLRLSYPEYGRYSQPIPLENVDSDLWAAAGGDVDRAAKWDVLIDFMPQAGRSIRAAFEVPFVAEVKDANTRTPSLLNWLSVAGLIILLGGWTIPYIYRYGSRLEWSAEMILIAVLGIGLLIGVIGGGVYMLQSTSQRVQEGRDPPPNQINEVFADQASLQVGATIYQQDCLSCHGVGGIHPATEDTPLLSQALAERNDEALYRIFSKGIVGRHIYGLDLSSDERWSLINYLRSFE